MIKKKQKLKRINLKEERLPLALNLQSSVQAQVDSMLWVLRQNSMVARVLGGCCPPPGSQEQERETGKCGQGQNIPFKDMPQVTHSNQAPPPSFPNLPIHIMNPSMD
jgi:hypothetical protein